MSGIITIRPLTPVGIDFDRLREESQALGFAMLDRLAVHWMDGSNAFSAPGERLLGAFLGDALVGVGGLNRCPFDNHPRAGRVRHLYVSHAVRRVGVGNQLLATLAHHAHNTFDYLNIRAPESAFSFYLQAGFLPLDHPHITHRLTLPSVA